MIQLDLNGQPLDKKERTEFIKVTLKGKTKTGYYSKCSCGQQILNLPRHYFCLNCQLDFYINNTLIVEFTKIEVLA